MNLSQTAKYAIRILCFMAIDESKMYTANQMTKALGISDKYLRRIMTKLSKSGLIKSIQGRNGGYVFAKSTQQIFLLDIITAVESPKKYTGCFLGFDNCSDEKPCAVHNEWAEARKPIFELLTVTALSDIVSSDFVGKI